MAGGSGGRYSRKTKKQLIDELEALRAKFAELKKSADESKWAEEVLIKGELVAAATIEGMPDGVMLVNMSGEISYVNKAFEKLLGYKANELVGTSALKLPTYSKSKDRVKAQGYLKKVIEKSSAKPIDMSAITKDGEEIPINFTASVIKDAQGNPQTLVAVIRDISERKWAEEALRDSEELARGMLAAATTGIYFLQDGRFLYVNRLFEEISGYTSDELVGKHSLDYVHPDDKKAVRIKAIEVLKGQSSSPYEFRLIRKDSGIVWVSDRVASIQYKGKRSVLGTLMDITERRKVEEALRESEEKYRLHFESISDVIYSIDTGFRVIRVSPSVEKLLGYKAEELVGKPFQELNILTHESLERAFSDAMRVFAGERVVATEYEFIAKDGTRRFGEVSGSPLYSKEGKVVATISVARDIKERKQAEEEVRRYTKQLEALFNIGATVSQTLNLEELLDSVLDTVLMVMGVEVGGIFLLDKQTSKLLLKTHRGMSPEFARRVQVVSIGDGFIGKVAKLGKPILAEDVSADSKLSWMRKMGDGIQSFAAVPIMAKEKILAVMGVGSGKHREFPDWEMLMLDTIANQIGMAIENAQLYEHALELAFTDGLTGLYNRRYIMEQIEREFIRAQRSKAPLSLIMVDLDELKAINDRFGHHEGDGFLKEVARIVKVNTRASDVAARWGGDEFMLLAPGTNRRSASKIAERIRAQVERYKIKLEGGEVGITVSAGIVSYPAHASVVEELLKKADEAMYNAKRGGKNQSSVFSP
jgi:diguanylate cyclase (GGDEF)-like protein/PAS domain S-box-containing protein